MKKFFIIFFILFAALNISTLANDNVYENKLFSITLPKELNGSYEIETQKDKISVFHTDSKKAGFGGFAFGIKAYKNPSDHAVLPGSKKIGELTDKRGNLYDVVIKYPTDVQYDYTKSTNPPKSFKQLYDYGENVKIQGTNGSNYYKGQGTKGEDLYREVLKKHITALNEKWNSSKLEQEDMSYMYNLTKNIGYTYYDVNVDGIDELLIGEIADGNWKGVIYDIYTMVNRKPKHVVSGGSRNRFYVCDGSFICNEYSSGALESGVIVYNLVENSTELYPQVNFKYDEYENSKKPYFISYSDNNWENVSEKQYNERIKTFEDYKRFNFTPLSKISKEFHPIKDKYNNKKDYFDYSAVISEFPKNYYYTTVKINKSKERVLIITDKINSQNASYRGLFYYIGQNGFVYPLGYLESTKPFEVSKNYIYLTENNKKIKIYMSDKKLEIIKSKNKNNLIKNKIIEFTSIKSSEKFTCNFGEPAGDDVITAKLDGFQFLYHKPQYKDKYIKTIMHKCIKDGVKTNVQMYCCVTKKLHS